MNTKKLKTVCLVLITLTGVLGGNVSVFAKEEENRIEIVEVANLPEGLTVETLTKEESTKIFNALKEEPENTLEIKAVDGEVRIRNVSAWNKYKWVAVIRVKDASPKKINGAISYALAQKG